MKILAKMTSNTSFVKNCGGEEVYELAARVSFISF